MTRTVKIVGLTIAGLFALVDRSAQFSASAARAQNADALRLQSKQLGISATFAKCYLKASGKALLKGLELDTSKCEAKLVQKLERLDQKFEPLDPLGQFGTGRVEDISDRLNGVLREVKEFHESPTDRFELVDGLFVKDHQTGLMWRKKRDVTEDDDPIHSVHRLFKYEDAVELEFLEDLNGRTATGVITRRELAANPTIVETLVVGGLPILNGRRSNDWRLPSVAEIATIYDPSTGRIVDPIFEPISDLPTNYGELVGQGWYWTSTFISSSKQNAHLVVSFRGNGSFALSFPNDWKAHAIAVRGEFRSEAAQTSFPIIEPPPLEPFCCEGEAISACGWATSVEECETGVPPVSGVPFGGVCTAQGICDIVEPGLGNCCAGVSFGTGCVSLGPEVGNICGILGGTVISNSLCLSSGRCEGEEVCPASAPVQCSADACCPPGDPCTADGCCQLRGGIRCEGGCFNCSSQGLDACCSDADQVVCCPPGDTCATGQCSSTQSPDPVCGNGVVEGFEQCESDADCDPGEECDFEQEPCSCILDRSTGFCGNGVLDTGEECETDADCADSEIGTACGFDCRCKGCCQCTTSNSLLDLTTCGYVGSAGECDASCAAIDSSATSERFFAGLGSSRLRCRGDGVCVSPSAPNNPGDCCDEPETSGGGGFSGCASGSHFLLGGCRVSLQSGEICTGRGVCE